MFAKSSLLSACSVKILNEFKVDHIIFGSETNNIDLLNQIVDIQLLDPEYENKVKEYLDLGFNYPTAMKKALEIDEDI